MDKKLSYTAQEIDARLGLIPTLEKSIANADINGRIFATISAASTAITKPKEGAWVLIGSGPYTIYRYTGTAWSNTGVSYQQGAATTTSQVTDTTQGKTQQTINAEVGQHFTQLESSLSDFALKTEELSQTVGTTRQATWNEIDLPSVSNSYICFKLADGTTIPTYSGKTDEEATQIFNDNLNNVSSKTTGTQKVWKLSSVFGHLKINIENVKKIRIKANEQFPAYYTLLSAYNVKSGETASFAEGYSEVVSIPKNTSVEINVGEDAKYLYIYAGRMVATETYVNAMIYVPVVESCVLPKSISEDLDDAIESLSELQSEIEEKADSEDIDVISQKVDDVEKCVEINNAILNGVVEKEYNGNSHYGFNINSTNGQEASSIATVFTTDYISIKGFDSITFLGYTRTGTTSFGAAIYDKDKVFVRGITYSKTSTSTSKEYTAIVGEGECYIRFTGYDTLTTKHPSYKLKNYTFGVEESVLSAASTVQYLWLHKTSYNENVGYFENRSKSYDYVYSYQIKKKHLYKVEIVKTATTADYYVNSGFSNSLPVADGTVEGYYAALMQGDSASSVYKEFVSEADGYIHIYIRNGYGTIKVTDCAQNYIDTLFETKANKSDIGNIVIQKSIEDFYTERKCNVTNEVVGNPQMPISFGSDTVSINGYVVDAPRTLQELNVMRLALQQLNIKWTPKKRVPKAVSSASEYDYYEPDVEVTDGIPYTRNDIRLVGTALSLETFMTAINNPYSLMYTELCYYAHPESDWGFVWRNINAYAYYGTVCVGFTSSVIGSDFKYGMLFHDVYAEDYGVLSHVYPDDYVKTHSPIEAFQYIKVGDILDDNKHAFVAIGIVRGTDGLTEKVLFAESTRGGGVDGCRIVGLWTKTRLNTELVSKYNSRGEYYKLYRPNLLYKNIHYKQSPFVCLTDFGETPIAYTYNNDICTFAGDKATFKASDLIVLNYNLANSASWDYTHIHLYKNGTLYGSYPISDISQAELPTDQKGHAIKFNGTLPVGVYEAKCGYADTSAAMSEPTYFDVVSDTVTITKGGKSNEYYVEYSGDIVSAFLCKKETDSKGEYFKDYSYDFQYIPSEVEKKNKKMLFLPVEQIEHIGYEDEVATIEQVYVRVIAKGKYGNVSLTPKAFVTQ